MSSDEDMPLSAGLSKSGTTGIAPGRMKTVSAKLPQGQRIEDAVEERQKLQADEVADEAGPSKTAAAADDDDDDGEDGGEGEESGEESGEEGLVWDDTHKDDENYLGEDVFKVEAIPYPNSNPKPNPNPNPHPNPNPNAFKVEAIRSKRRGDKGPEYLIKWEGYASDVNSWEPAAHVCEEDIAEYEAKLLLQRNKEGWSLSATRGAT